MGGRHHDLLELRTVGRPAEHAAATLTKGQRTILVGIIRTDTWTDSDDRTRALGLGIVAHPVRGVGARRFSSVFVQLGGRMA